MQNSLYIDVIQQKFNHLTGENHSIRGIAGKVTSPVASFDMFAVYCTTQFLC